MGAEPNRPRSIPTPSLRYLGELRFNLLKENANRFILIALGAKPPIHRSLNSRFLKSFRAD
jgi:hypothetical protein